MNTSKDSNDMTLPRWAMRICVVALMALALSGCLSKPPMNVQTFAFSTPATSGTNEAVSGHVLGIKSLQVAPPFNNRSLVYRTGEFSYQPDPYAQFLDSPAEVLFTPISEMLRSEGGFSAVVRAGDAAKPDMMVEINATQLYGDIRNSKSPVAVLSMQVIFMRAVNGMPERVVFRRNYSRQIPMKATSAAALMDGWNQALTEIIAEAVSDFRSQGNE